MDIKEMEKLSEFNEINISLLLSTAELSIKNIRNGIYRTVVNKLIQKEIDFFFCFFIWNINEINVPTNKKPDIKYIKVFPMKSKTIATNAMAAIRIINMISNPIK